MRVLQMLIVASAWGLSCSSDHGEVPSDWRSVDSHCEFSFQAPPDYSEVSAVGTDSCVLTFEASGCKYGADYGMYSGAVTGTGTERGYQRSEIRIDGQDAEIVCYTSADAADLHFCAVHFEQVGPTPSVKLTVTALCESADSAASARTLFRSIRFQP